MTIKIDHSQNGPEYAPVRMHVKDVFHVSTEQAKIQIT